MKLVLLVLLAVTALCMLGCYPGISGVVVDAETHKPIEGAVVLAQWTKTHGIGDPWHSVYKIIETETDFEGKFILSGVYNPTVDKPTLVIIKRGYVAWRNDIVFPGYTKRMDCLEWKSGYRYALATYTSSLDRYVHSVVSG